MIARKFVNSDKDDVNKLIEEFSVEALADLGFKYDKSHIEVMVELCKDHTFVLIDDGKLCGILAGMIAPAMANGDIVYQEIMWFVTKEKRKYGLKLLKAAEDYCVASNIKKIIMVHLGNSTCEKTKKFYERSGYRHLETQYIKEV